MAYDPGAIDATLAAAFGEYPDLIRELRGAFLESAEGHLVRLQNCPDTREWADTARRLKGLAASFGAKRLLDAAEQVVKTVPVDKAAILRVERALVALPLRLTCTGFATALQRVT